MLTSSRRFILLLVAVALLTGAGGCAAERSKAAAAGAPTTRPVAITAGGDASLTLDEIPDRPEVVEALVLEQCEPGRVIASILEALQAMNEERLRSPRPDVSDDSTHPGAPFVSRGLSGDVARRP